MFLRYILPGVENLNLPPPRRAIGTPAIVARPDFEALSTEGCEDLLSGGAGISDKHQPWRALFEKHLPDRREFPEDRLLKPAGQLFDEPGQPVVNRQQ